MNSRLGWLVGFGLIIAAAVLGIAQQAFWQMLSAGGGLIILGFMPILDDNERPLPIIIICAFMILIGSSMIAGALGGGGL